MNGLTGVAAGGGVMERAEAFACAHVHRAVSFNPPQQNAIRYVGLRVASHEACSIVAGRG